MKRRLLHNGRLAFAGTPDELVAAGNVWRGR